MVAATQTQAGRRWRCERSRLGRLAVDGSDAKARGEIRNLGGEPRGFIGATGARRATIRLDLRACHAHCCVMSLDTGPQSLSFPIENHGGRFAFPRRIRTLFPPREGRSQRFFLFWAHLGPRSLAAGPTEGGSTNDPKSRLRALLGSRSMVKP